MRNFVLFFLVAVGAYTIVETCKPTPVHCKWNSWARGECSAACGTGTRTYTRTKKVVEKDGGTCSGQKTKKEQCKVKECPVHCEWGPWAVTECDKTCGGGTLTKTREKAQEAKHAGNECTGASTITESCNDQECPVDCRWSEWEIGECSAECDGGYRPKFREIEQEHLYGGIPCEGVGTEVEACNTHNCPEPCVWGDWELGECSATCAGGTRIDTREKITEAKYGGTCDPMDHQRTEPCNTEDCPPIHCVWDEWVMGECSKTCGTGIQINTRTKKVVEKDGGACTGPPTEEKECKIIECPVHCEWDEWQIGQCSLTCGGGTRNNTREEKVSAQHGGNECEGLPSIIESCNVNECPVDCVWGEFVNGECSVTCDDGVQTNNRTILAEEQFGGQPCEGETSVVESCYNGPCPRILACPEEKSTACSTYAHYYPHFCEDTPGNAWFLGEEGRYCCRRSCDLC